jgi:aminobenzoyl-glutamate utilization protein B
MISLTLMLLAAEPRQTDAFLDQTRPQWEALSRQLWDFSETAHQETRSSKALGQALEKEGFKVTWGSGGQPTAFIATAGSGAPVIGFIAEYDALPGLSQAAGVAKAQPRVNGAPGHGCGHNLLGTAGVAAAIAVNRERIARKLPGTLRLFGTPSEENTLGKAFMLRDGAFEQTDLVLSWHPDEQNRVLNRNRLACTGLNVEFFGRTAHAAVSPWLGRSALDALALFDHAVALMREHVHPTARIHRVVRDGGGAPNVIPDHASGEYWLRDADIESVNEMLARLRKAADGAALATETRAQVSLLFSTRNPVPNDTLALAMQKELERVGAPAFDASDVAFAKAMQAELGAEPVGLPTTVLPFTKPNGVSSSSDIAEVSAALPTGEVGIVVRPLGTPIHHWAQTSSAAHPLGWKGMLVAAKVIAATKRRPAQRPRDDQGREGGVRRADEGKAVCLAAPAGPEAPEALIAPAVERHP